MKKISKAFTLSSAVYLLLLMLGCAQQTIVPLTYEPVSLPVSGCPHTLVVLPFEDAREDTVSIGLTAQGTPFYPEDFVEDWFSTALMQQLRALGCTVKPGLRDNPQGENLIQGEIKTAFLRQHSRSEYTVSLGMTLIVEKDGTKAYEEQFSVELQKWVLPKQEAPALFLKEALQEIMRAAVPKLLAAVRQAS